MKVRFIGHRPFVRAPRHRTLTRLHDRIHAREIERRERVREILKRERPIKDTTDDEREGRE
jgi:hypothetical protein